MCVETLRRIGIPSKKDKTLYQSCHILHKRGQFAILHFKEMFGLDGKQCNMTEEDFHRRNRIAKLLEEWGLVKITDQSDLEEGMMPVQYIKILPHKEASNWNLVEKYAIGKKRGQTA